MVQPREFEAFLERAKGPLQEFVTCGLSIGRCVLPLRGFWFRLCVWIVDGIAPGA